MPPQSIRALQERTNAKLRYAGVFLKELAVKAGPPSGDDFERAHQEGFLFHLFGARDAFLAELDRYYEIGLGPEGLTIGKLRQALEKRGSKSPELRMFYRLEHDTLSWFARAKNMRDHSTHVQGMKRQFALGGRHHHKARLTDPLTGAVSDQDVVADFGSWLNEMSSLLVTMRQSAQNPPG